MKKNNPAYRGRIKNGVVVLDPGQFLPEGVAVAVLPVVPRTPQLTLEAKLQRLAGRARGLPRDMARNHNHYLHGTPKS